ncbi:hypothetical protein ACEPAI_313 [Sanghuangporus weigelae]
MMTKCSASLRILCRISLNSPRFSASSGANLTRIPSLAQLNLRSTIGGYVIIQPTLILILTSWMMSIRKQLEEIHLLQCSLIPPELFDFVLPQDDCEQWSQLLHRYTQDGQIPDDDWQPASTCRFEVRIEDGPIWFEVELPRGYPEAEAPNVFVRGKNLQRVDQERWREIVNDKLSQVREEGTDFQVQSLLCLHLIPLLHEELNVIQAARTSLQSSSSSSEIVSHPTREAYHVLFTSHHLISPTKRRNLQKWSAELSLHGFAKVGYPGAIYAEGTRADISEFVGRVKAMQWLALKVRFEEKLDVEKYGQLDLGDEINHAPERKERRKRWIELEKVGEVVDVMRRSGREEIVTDMGLGTNTTGNASTSRS